MNELLEGKAYLTEEGKVVLTENLRKTFYNRASEMLCEDGLLRHARGKLAGKLISLTSEDQSHPMNFVSEYITPSAEPTLSKSEKGKTPKSEEVYSQLALF